MKGTVARNDPEIQPDPSLASQAVISTGRVDLYEVNSGQ